MRKKLARAARTALTQCLVLKPDEKLLVIVNPETRRIGEALYKEGLKITPQTLLMVYPKGTINGEEPPALVSEVMMKSDVIVAPTVMSVTHTAARRRACKLGARMATMPGITEDFFVRGLERRLRGDPEDHQDDPRVSRQGRRRARHRPPRGPTS